MYRARKSRKPGWPTLITIILLMIVIGVGLFGIHLWEQRQIEDELAQYEDSTDQIPLENLSIAYNGKQYKLRDNLDTYLFIGLDKYSDTLSDPEYHTNNQQADFLILMVVDKSAKSYSAIHINRDSMSEIQRLGMSGKKIGTFTGQLALAHTFGRGGKDSCRNTAQAVSHFLLDIPVEHYFSLTMDAIAVLNDLVGGVTVTIEDDFSAIDPSLVQGKTVRLKGQQALTFVRGRMHVGDGSNVSRMNRQRVFIDALYEQMTQKLQSDDGFAAKLAKRIADYSVSDMTTTDLSNLAERLKDYRYTGIRTISGDAVKGEKYMEFYADEEALRSLVVQVFCRQG